MTKHIRFSFSSQFSKDARGHKLTLDDTQQETGLDSSKNSTLFTSNQSLVDTCPYKSFCPLPQYSMKCNFNRDECRGYCFYDKWGNYLQ